MMKKITAIDVNKLRKQTGAGMMDCKNALVEAKGDFEEAIDILRKKGQKVAAKRADREASEGVVISKTDSENRFGIIISLNCETDFVAKNEDFVNLAHSITDEAIKNEVNDINELNDMFFNGMKISEKITEQTGVIGEKLELSMSSVKAEQVSSYIHPGSRLATLVGFNKNINEQVAREIAMQVAAMNPLAVDRDNVSEEIVERELKIGMDQAREEGKPEQMLEKIAQGRLNKFFKENTLLNQSFIKDNKKTVKQYLNEHSKDLSVTSFERFGLGS